MKKVTKVVAIVVAVIAAVCVFSYVHNQAKMKSIAKDAAETIVSTSDGVFTDYSVQRTSDGYYEIELAVDESYMENASASYILRGTSAEDIAMIDDIYLWTFTVDGVDYSYIDFCTKITMDAYQKAYEETMNQYEETYNELMDQYDDYLNELLY